VSTARVAPTSVIEPHAWHSGHRPTHLATVCPHSLQRWEVRSRTPGLAMAGTLAAPCDNERGAVRAQRCQDVLTGPGELLDCELPPEPGACEDGGACPRAGESVDSELTSTGDCTGTSRSAWPLLANASVSFT